MYFLLQSPDTFRRYLLMSPGWDYNHRMLFQQEAEFALHHRRLPIRVFASAGSEEPGCAHTLQEFTTILRSRGYEGLEVEAVILDGETHFSQGARAFTTGIRALYRRAGMG